MRNISKWAEEGRKIIEKNSNKGLTLNEYMDFVDLAKSGNIEDAVSKAFYMGVSVGASTKA